MWLPSPQFIFHLTIVFNLQNNHWSQLQCLSPTVLITEEYTLQMVSFWALTATTTVVCTEPSFGFAPDIDHRSLIRLETGTRPQTILCWVVTFRHKITSNLFWGQHRHFVVDLLASFNKQQIEVSVRERMPMEAKYLWL